MTNASWNRDPTGRHQLRYWDGTNWTEHVADDGATSTDPLAIAGWKSDPTGRHQLRYWDGTNWTNHVSDNGATTTDPLAAHSPGATLSSDGPRFSRLPLRARDAGPAIHALDAIQRGDSFPLRRDMFDLGGIELPILFDRDEIPVDAIELAVVLLRACELEPTESRTTEAARTVIAALRTVFESSFPTKRDAIDRWVESGGPKFDPLRALFADVDRGADIVDFELLKLMTILCSPTSPIRLMN